MTEQLVLQAPSAVDPQGEGASDDALAPSFLLPSRTSFSPTTLGHSAGLFQEGPRNARRLRSTMSVPTLIGVTATTDRPLGGVEFDMTTVLCRRIIDAPILAERRILAEAREAGASPDETTAAIATARAEAEKTTLVETTGHALCKEIYGYVGGEQRRLVYQALDKLVTTTLTLPGIDVQTGQLDGSALSKTRIISDLVVFDKNQHFNVGEAEGDYSLAKLFGSTKGTATVKATLPDWLCTAARFFHGRELDFRVQRALPGLAKTLWLRLEALEFLPVPGAEASEEEFALSMDPHTLAWLGTNCRRPADNVARIRAQLRRIIEIDPTYLGAEVIKDARDRRRVAHIRIVRAKGEYRQTLLRAHARRLVGGTVEGAAM